jgi:hypothetical protein
MIDRAAGHVDRTRGVFCFDSIVVGRPGFEVVDAHTEHGGGMPEIQSDGILRSLIQMLRVDPIMYDSIVYGRAARVIYGPPDDRQILGTPLE